MHCLQGIDAPGWPVQRHSARSSSACDRFKIPDETGDLRIPVVPDKPDRRGQRLLPWQHRADTVPRPFQSGETIRQDRIRNALLVIIAALLLLHMSGRSISRAHALIDKRHQRVDVTNVLGVQKTMDRAAAEGWEYFGSMGHVAIIKRYFA
ncbi:hypothetical protein [Methylotetracoccus oryzae]|uniref:hypothetical protein n=1 Tax=Methylotetracoccus oryzae TaxID=1919059 RepID=UPI001117E206|nr:hypothetical protein [Methylotetracoccus oryzae]